MFASSIMTLMQLQQQINPKHRLTKNRTWQTTQQHTKTEIRLLIRQTSKDFSLWCIWKANWVSSVSGRSTTDAVTRGSTCWSLYTPFRTIDPYTCVNEWLRTCAVWSSYGWNSWMIQTRLDTKIQNSCIFKYENVVEEEEVAGLEALAAHLQ